MIKEELQELLTRFSYDYDKVIKELEKNLGIKLDHIREDLINLLKENRLDEAETLIFNFFYSELENAYDMIKEISGLLARYHTKSLGRRRLHDIISSLKHEVEEQQRKLERIKVELKEKQAIEKEVVNEAIKTLSEFLAIVAYLSKLEKRYFK